ncbi:hypothetical protein [Streptomyces sp. NPDC002540]
MSISASRPAETGSGGSCGDLAVGRNPKVDGRGPASAVVELSKLVFRGGKADAQSLGLAEPAIAFGLSDPLVQIAADLFGTEQLSRVDAKNWAADAAVFVLASGAVGATAVAQSDLSPLEVAKELFPLGIGGVRYSSLGRNARRRAMKAQWLLIASSG